MRRLLAFVLVLCSLFSCAYAHSGKTDSSGGHKDKYNESGLGSYHYHHGYSAHLHPNGVCPYASTSKTQTTTPATTARTTTARTTAARTTTASTTSATTTNRTAAAATTSASTANKKDSPLLVMILILCCLPFAIAGIIASYELCSKIVLKIVSVFQNVKIKIKEKRLAKATDNTPKQAEKRDAKIFVLGLALIVFVVACAKYMYESYRLNEQYTTLLSEYNEVVSSYNDLHATYNDLNTTYNDLNGKYEAKLDEYKDLAFKYNDINPEYKFYHEHAVIVVVNGQNYHKYNCNWIMYRDFYIYNKETAIALGLEPCYDCYYEDIKW